MQKICIKRNKNNIITTVLFGFFAQKSSRIYAGESGDGGFRKVKCFVVDKK